MKLITRFELASRITDELHTLYRHTFNALCRCKPHSGRVAKEFPGPNYSLTFNSAYVNECKASAHAPRWVPKNKRKEIRHRPEIDQEWCGRSRFQRRGTVPRFPPEGLP